MKNCKQIATEWGLSERTVNDLCKKNKIDGAIKVGKMWKIPDDAKKPIDGRITSGKYVRHIPLRRPEPQRRKYRHWLKKPMPVLFIIHNGIYFGN